MANKITGLFKKNRTFPKKPDNNEIRDMFDDIHDRLLNLEKDVKQLIKQSKK